MKLRFWTDPETGLPHIYEHRVTKEEARQVLVRPKLNYPGLNGSRIVLGQTAAGRVLKIVYVPDAHGDGGFVVTSYELHGKALKAYRRALRRRKR